MTEKIFYHVDVNSAFLSWSAAFRKAKGIDKVDLRTIPSAVGGDSSKRHGIITAKSIPAKKYGIHTGEPVIDAVRKCPTLVLIPPDFDLYVRESSLLMNLLKKYAPVVEQFSIDEAFCDMTGTRSLYGDPVDFAYKLKDEIRDTLGFTVNIGVAHNRLLAKMASDFTKPDRVHTLFEEETPDKMWPLPVGDLLYVGKSTAAKLNELGIRTIGDLAHTPENLLMKRFGKHGEEMHRYANGIEGSNITGRRKTVRGFSNEITVSHDVETREEAELVLLSLCETVAARIRADHAKVSVITVYYKDYNFKTTSRQGQLPSSTSNTQTIYEKASSLFAELWDGHTPIRLMGVRGSHLDEDTSVQQMDLFDHGRQEKMAKLDAAIDNLRDKFGDDSVKRAVFLQADEKDLKHRHHRSADTTDEDSANNESISNEQKKSAASEDTLQIGGLSRAKHNAKRRHE